MKGKQVFTTSESKRIKELISEKCEAARNEQNTIRSKIRKMGFYYSDFSSSKHGYTVSDFQSFTDSGRIIITDDTE